MIKITADPQDLKQINVKFILFDIGGTSVKASLYENENLYYHLKSIPTNPQTLEIKMQEIIDKYYSNNLLGVAICSMGAVNSKTNKIFFANEKNNWIKNINFNRLISKYPHLKLTLINDANAAAIFEFDKLVNVNNFALFTFGTGIGSGIILDKKLFTGHNWLGGEIGYLKFGNLSLDDKFSFSSFYQNIKQKYNFSMKDTALLAQNFAANSAFKNELNNYLTEIGNFLGSIAIILNLDAISFGGGLSNLEDKYLQAIHDGFNQYLANTPFKTKLLKAQSSNYAGVFGALSWWRTQFQQ
ncbi:putative NBD/HSP70 family sugar kinase [Mycoplasmoides fastidiosum]|uniref:NBD/HSP70 family sugar kinase n=1 Tax=Mycoplasmoides fastidiosum TaxID=92758 RepID=A0ABU0LYV7_9BACT|nr:ROK family protein [Mycoplasmoides fastidiosum]MDQ0513873.1 putative NBD/HSP70 family sugar kinase [Mycoplasmoides fastidiosum]UUD37713.1 ROK family protein [Mycoplasmoides fastidiosum]